MSIDFENLYRQADDEADRLFVQLHSALDRVEQAREEGRQEMRDAVNALFDAYSPHAVEWWNKMNALTKPAFRDSKMK